MYCTKWHYRDEMTSRISLLIKGLYCRSTENTRVSHWIASSSRYHQCRHNNMLSFSRWCLLRANTWFILMYALLLEKFEELTCFTTCFLVKCAHELRDTFFWWHGAVQWWYVLPTVCWIDCLGPEQKKSGTVFFIGNVAAVNSVYSIRPTLLLGTY